jgi:hypothetical protein
VVLLVNNAESDAYSWTLDADDHHPESVIRGKSLAGV